MTTAQHGYVMVDGNDKGAWQKLELEVPTEEIGYIYIYVANESMDGADVYFDDALVRRSGSVGGEVQLIDAPLTSASDYYPFGLAMADSSYSSEKYRFGYQGQFAEMDEETGWNSFEARMYDPLIGRWLAVDPARQFSSPYRTGNNPINSVDPDGRREYGNGFKILHAFGIGSLGAGDWYKSDRVNNTSVWQSANSYNLTQTSGFNEYTTITQRTAFYGWFDQTTQAMGFETNWPGAAEIVAGQMSLLDNPLVAQIVGDDVVAFGNAGNKAIFDDVFGNLSALISGPALKGGAALAWDMATLHNEQFNVVQPLYEAQSAATIQTLSRMASGQGVFGIGLRSDLRFKGNILNPQDRFNHGAGPVTDYLILYRQWQSIYSGFHGN
jgi:RHS repeat-associated protein